MQQRSDRIKSLSSVSQFRVGALLVQPERLMVVVEDREVALEPRLMEVLVALAERAGEVVSAEQLLIEVWRGSFYGDNPVHRAIAQLRRLIGDSSRAPIYIETIRKRGYRLIARVLFPDDYRRAPASMSTWTQGSPYVGLSSFDDRHANVFFGRSRMTAELLGAVRRQIDNQRRFVLVLGASGCGKTSLLRAGVIPLLLQDSGFDGLQALSVGYCDLAACHDGDALEQLASALSTWSLEDRPVFARQPPKELAQGLRRDPAMAARAVAEALSRTTVRGLPDRPHAHFLLAIDHGEALVASPAIDQRERRAFAEVLHHLCDQPHVAVAMVARSDFYPRLIEAMPEVIERKGGDGHVDVLTPRRGEIAQIIRAPATVAGLVFEEDRESSARLDDVLRDAAAEHDDALPLLQHTLQALYERRTDSGELTFGAYRQIGGLVGALAHRAEEVFATLPAAAQARLHSVLEQLIVVNAEGDSVSARRALWSSLGDDPARELAEAFVRARLFVGELSDGKPGFGVAHEALLRQWPRAREWTQDNRRLLQARARLQRAATRWSEEGRRQDHLLNPGRPLSEATEAAQRMGRDIGQHERDFLNASQRQHRRKRWLRVGATAALAVFSAIAVIFGVLAEHARRESEQRREQALQLADFMLGDLAEQLRPLGNLKLLDAIGAQALSYLEQIPGSGMRTEDLVNHSRALRTVGEVLMNKGDFDAARSAFVRSSAAASAALAREPDSVDALAETGTAAYWLGYHDYRQKRLDAAHAHWSAYLAASERLVRLEPTNADWQLELSYALNNLGTLAHSHQRIDEAVARFERSAAIKRRVIAERPLDRALRYDLIDTLSWTSSGHESLGHLGTAAEGYAEQIAMLRTLVAEAPEAHAWERRLATSLLRSASLALARGQLEDAAAQADESTRRLARLVRQEPGNMVWHRDLAHARMEAARMARLRGDDAAATAHLKQARALSSALLSGAEPLPEWQRLDALVRLQLAQADPRIDSSAATDLAIADLNRLAEQAPGDLAGAVALSSALIERGQQRRRLGQTQGARADWARAAAMLASSARSSRDRTLLDPWLSAQILLGHHGAVADRLAWIHSIGYRHPEFLALQSDPANFSAGRPEPE
ncbi:MAG: winged helix-turn-helix domain-containing protein [Pseudomonadota bacterium]|nr:winged helix-turn-helix domain-containing protein [Pseudomonadota bacterium]